MALIPFNSYPGCGRELLELVKGSNCRREYGLQFMRLTGEKCCAYCDADLTAVYESWLTMALDHVVPASVCHAMHIPSKWCEDFSNTVLACGACNGFCNRYCVPIDIVPPDSLPAFYDLRDRTFVERKKLILARHEEESQFFNINVKG
jgi:hypothetical protein